LIWIRKWKESYFVLPFTLGTSKDMRKEGYNSRSFVDCSDCKLLFTRIKAILIIQWPQFLNFHAFPLRIIFLSSLLLIYRTTKLCSFQYVTQLNWFQTLFSWEGLRFGWFIYCEGLEHGTSSTRYLMIFCFFVELFPVFHKRHGMYLFLKG